MSNEKERNEKVELAKRIAGQGKRVAKTYESIESSLLKIVRFVSYWIDRLLFNQRYGKVISVALAVLLFFTINYGDESIIGGSFQQGDVIKNIPITTNVNDELFEISGLPEYADATITGELSDIQMVKNQSEYQILADLTGKGEGTHEIELTTTDISSRVNVSLNPSHVVVTIKKKIISKFTIGYDFINTPKMDAMYALGTPEFETTEVMVRASDSTMKDIAFVKALIDVSGQTSTFTTEAELVAYDESGLKIDVDLIPSTVNVTVPVSSPNKSVPIVIEPNGTIPNNLAIETINLDHASVTMYGSDSVLANITDLIVPIDVSELTGNSSFYANIILPSGVKKSSISKVTLDIQVGEAVEGLVEDVNIFVNNNVNNYQFRLINDAVAVIDVELYGTQANIDNILADDIYVYFDMEGIEPGIQEVQLYVTGTNPYVRYSLVNPIISIEVVE